MDMIYKTRDVPNIFKVLVFAFQQLLAILAATILVPALINSAFPDADIGMAQSAALFGAGVGTLVYLCFTRFKSPVFLGSSFAFIPSMTAAFAGALTSGLSKEVGYFGVIVGAAMAGLVYVILAIIVKCTGTKWVNKILPPAVIGPIVATIGISLAGNAVLDIVGRVANTDGGYVMNLTSIAALVCGLVALFTTILCSVYGKKMVKMIPFIIGICAGYAVATLFTYAGKVFEIPEFVLIDFSKVLNFTWVPEFTFWKGFKGFEELKLSGEMVKYLVAIAVAYVPVAVVVFAEHLADHRNLSTIIDHDLLENPGLHNTLLGDGVGSMVGAFFGGCPNTTYGESVACVAISKNASVITTVFTALLAIGASFCGPFCSALSTIPGSVMGGICFALYGFIAVSGLKMIQKVDLNNERNLFVVSTILIAGIGGLALNIKGVILTSVASAMILGIVLNLILREKPGKKSAQELVEEILEEKMPDPVNFDVDDEEFTTIPEEFVMPESASYKEALLDTVMAMSDLRVDLTPVDEVYTEEKEETPEEVKVAEVEEPTLETVKQTKFAKYISKKFSAEELRHVLNFLDTPYHAHKKANVLLVEDFVMNKLNKLTRDELRRFGEMLGEQFEVVPSMKKTEMVDRIKGTAELINK